MNYQELVNVTNNVYLLKGDAFLCKETKNKIANVKNVTQINISEFDEENFDVVQVINACNQYSFFDENRLVVVQDIKKELNSENKKIIQKYCDKPNETCILVFIDTLNIGVFDFVKNAELIECKASDYYLTNYVKSQFEKQGKKIEQLQCKSLIESCLSNINKLNLEIKKICDYMQEESIVTQQILDILVYREIELKVFDLTAALGYKNKDKSLKLVYDMLEAGEAPIKIMGLISAQFRRTFFAKINKGSTAELAKSLGCKEFAVIKAKEQASKFTASELKNIINFCMEADFSIKNGDMTMENSLYYLILKILNG